MSYLFLLIGYISFIACAFLIEKRLPDHLKRYCFITAIALITVILYAATFFINLYHTQYVLYGILFVSVIYETFKNKLSNLKIFFVNYRLIFIVSLVWFIFTFNVQIIHWDDFSWASFVKHLNYFGSYWTSTAAILDQGLRYFPGLSLWENFFIGRNNFSEQPLFFSLGLICISCFNIFLTPGLGNKKTFWLFVVFCASISWFTSGLGTISVEASMAFILASGIIATFDLKTPQDLCVPFIIALFMAITKETGFLLSLLIVLLVVIKILREKRFISKWLSYSMLCLFIILLNYQLWQWHLKSDPALKPFDSQKILTLIAQDINQLSANSKEILTTFFKALYNRPIGRSYLSRLPIPGFIYIKGFYLFWTALICFFLFKIKEKYEYLFTFFWGLTGYSLVLLITFLYVFSDYEGPRLASYERYIGVYFLAFSLVAIKVSLDNQLWKNHFISKLIIALLVIIPPFPKILYVPTFLNILPEPIASIIHLKKDKSRDEVKAIRSKITNLTPEKSKIWFIWQNSNGLQAMIVRYEIAPRKMNTGLWNIGKKYFEEDVWTADISLEDFSRELQIYDYVALGHIDENFIKNYSNMFITLPKSETVYKKEFINNVLKLKEI